MSFSSLQIRYQTARSLPAPYAYFLTLTARPSSDRTVGIDLAITYPDRDDIADDELIAEGYTRDDDYSWEGQLPEAWLMSLTDLIAKIRLQPSNEDDLGDDDDFWDVAISTSNGNRHGSPQQTDEWQYLLQELIQATYEVSGRERPFELTYLHGSSMDEVEVQVTASFAKRSVTVLRIQNRQQSSQTMPWETLQKLMSQVYAHEFNPDEAQTKRPDRVGHWLKLGPAEWYNINKLQSLIPVFTKLCL